MKKSLVSATSPWLGAFAVQRNVTPQPLCKKSFHQSLCLMGLLSSTALGLKHLQEFLLHFFWFPTKVSTSKLWVDNSDRVPVTCSVAPLWSDCSAPGCSCLWAVLLPKTDLCCWRSKWESRQESLLLQRQSCFSERQEVTVEGSLWQMLKAVTCRTGGSPLNLKCQWMCVSVHAWKFIHGTQTPW